LPILLKFIDANDRLSIQVHPDDEYARKHESGRSGKTEVWYVLDAGQGSTVIHGFREGFEQKRIQGFVKKRIYKDLYREVIVEKGDVIFVPAGTVHALNGGLVAAEIQQPSDLTYRLYDYERTDAAGKKRPLHIDKALDVLDYRTYKAVFRGLAIRNDKITGRYLAMSGNFCVRQVESAGDPIELNADGTLSAWMLLSGEAEVSSKIEKVCARALDTVLIPAFLGKYRMEGRFSALQIFRR
jgi:mannose-6-phosphate isomerase